MKAVVAMAIGERYLREFNANFRPAMEIFAKKIGADMHVVTEMIEPSSKHPSWQKLLLFRLPQLAKYEKILYLDADILVNRNAKDTFEAIGKKPWGMSPNNAYNLPNYAVTDLDLYKNCPPDNRPSFVLNSGMFVMSREYAPAMEKIFNEQPEQSCYEQGPLSYFLINEGKGVVLPPEFNTIVFAYVQAFGFSLSSVMKMYETCGFLHFTARKCPTIFHFLKWYDGLDSKIARGFIKAMSSKKLDWLTTALFSLAEKSLGVYSHRIKKKLS